MYQDPQTLLPAQQQSQQPQQPSESGVTLVTLPVPPGWDAHWDQGQQKYYYHHTATGQTTWEYRECFISLFPELLFQGARSRNWEGDRWAGVSDRVSGFQLNKARYRHPRRPNIHITHLRRL